MLSPTQSSRLPFLSPQASRGRIRPKQPSTNGRREKESGSPVERLYPLQDIASRRQKQTARDFRTSGESGETGSAKENRGRITAIVHVISTRREGDREGASEQERGTREAPRRRCRTVVDLSFSLKDLSAAEQPHATRRLITLSSVGAFLFSALSP